MFFAIIIPILFVFFFYSAALWSMRCIAIANVCLTCMHSSFAQLHEQINIH
ncbi:hypothetical protein HMPREF1579_00709 [Gardnerella vaginalis JCP8066]|nr:hypothetical protein HMPREF1582_00884 [Gardnerella vaginalis JCP8151A]EPI59849.1 hypothetical protein HMPREF1579_00709 [Gardnerella vaginalis JCP8066]